MILASGSETHRRILWAALAFVVLAGTQPTKTSQGAAVRLPSKLESYLTAVVRPTPAERKRLMDGAPITKLLDADPNREVVVFGAVWINAPVKRYVEAVNDIENFERGGGFRVTKRISTPPRLEDFAKLDLSEEDVADLRTCRVGDCELKLGEQALQTFRTEVDWNAPTAQAAADGVMRRIAYEYVTGYLEGGNERLAVYRDKSRPTFVATEFRSMVDQMPELTTYMPNTRRYLLEYPNFEFPGSTSFLYWQETQFGLKPRRLVVASKMLYANHYFWTALELRALVPDPSRGPGFWFATVNRSRSDGLSGFVGRVVRGRVRGEVEKAALAALTSTKSMLEKGR